MDSTNETKKQTRIKKIAEELNEEIKTTKLEQHLLDDSEIYDIRSFRNDDSILKLEVILIDPEGELYYFTQ